VTLQIELAPEVEQQLVQEAARHGQPPAEYAGILLKESLTAASSRPKLLPDGLPPDPPEQLLALAAAQGVKPVTDPNLLLGDWTDDDGTDDTDVDAFLRDRQQWKWEGSVGFPYDDAPDCSTRRKARG